MSILSGWCADSTVLRCWAQRHYAIGAWLGKRSTTVRFCDDQAWHRKTHDFYERHGGKT